LTGWTLGSRNKITYHSDLSFFLLKEKIISA
jgi:hypothetical protein